MALYLLCTQRVKFVRRTYFDKLKPYDETKHKKIMSGMCGGLWERITKSYDKAGI